MDTKRQNTDRLRTLLVRDVMSAVDVSIPAHTTLTEAARTLHERRITGAPVVDETGRCVGVLSMSDIGREAYRSGSNRDELLSFGFSHQLMKVSEDEAWTIESLAEDRVAMHMTRDVHCIPANAPLLRAAQHLCEFQVHRLIIVDRDDRPIGIVTALDIVASMVAAAEEQGK